MKQYVKIEARNINRFIFNTMCIQKIILPIAASAVFSGCRASMPERPNVIVMIVDDMGYGDVSALNPDSKIRTPNIDRLVREGVHFTDGYSNSSLSTATRYGLMTGRYTFRGVLKSYVTSGYDDLIIEQGRMTLASMLKGVGYNTAVVGKWHLGLGWQKTPGADSLIHGDNFIPDIINIDFTKPVTKGPGTCGFDYSFIFPGAADMSPYCYLENGMPLVTEMVPEPGVRNVRGKALRPGIRDIDYKPEGCLDIFTEKMIQYLKSVDRRKPFFLYAPSNAPHIPWEPAPQFAGSSGAGPYGDFVLHFDHTLGRILNTLDELDMTKNTLFIFLSDNGATWTDREINTYNHLSNHIFKGSKGDSWEGGHRVPFIVRYPAQFKGGGSSSLMVCATDVMATIAEIVGVKLPKDAGEDSFSFYPALKNPSRTKPVRENLILHSGYGMFALRMDEWKFIDGQGSGGFNKTKRETPECPTGQLYNLKNDVGESTNVACDHPEKVTKMKKELERLIVAGRSRK